MANYTTFGAVVSKWQKSHNIKIAKSEFLKGAGLAVKKHIQVMHGSSALKPNSPITIAFKGKNSPLVDSGKLRNSVVSLPSTNFVIITSTSPFLQRLHEYGAKWKMTDRQRKYLMARMTQAGITPKKKGSGYITIPPRPIWRKALGETRGEVVQLLQSVFKKHFSN